MGEPRALGPSIPAWHCPRCGYAFTDKDAPHLCDPPEGVQTVEDGPEMTPQDWQHAQKSVSAAWRHARAVVGAGELPRCMFGAATTKPCEQMATIYCDDGHEMWRVAWCDEHKVNCRGHAHPPINAGAD